MFLRLLQHKWKYFNSVLETSVGRSDFMSVLGNIEYVLIKASYGSRLQQSRYRCTPAWVPQVTLRVLG